MSARRSLAWLAAVLFAAAWPDDAWALSVSPSVVELRVAPGGTAQGVFRVINDAPEPTAIAVEVESLSSTGYVQRPPQAWLSLSLTTLHLNPQEQAEVAYVITVPPDVAGEFAAEVVFVQHLAGGLGGVQVRFGMALYVSVAGTERLQIDVGSMRLYGGESPAVIIPITNSGNVHCRPEGSVVVSSGTRHTLLAMGHLSRGLPAPPGQVVTFTVGLPTGRLKPGVYQLHAELTCHTAAELPSQSKIDQRGRLNAQGQWQLIPTASLPRP